jgi:hypothetical protein
MPKKVDTCDTEDKEQTKLAVWLDKNHILYFAIANGGSRHVLEAMKLKRTGVKSGVPDICVPVPSGIFHGLYIEMKRIQGGVLSANQKDWIEKLRSNGYCAEVAYGFEDAKSVVRRYFDMHNDNLLVA